MNILLCIIGAISAIYGLRIIILSIIRQRELKELDRQFEASYAAVMALLHERMKQ